MSTASGVVIRGRNLESPRGRAYGFEAAREGQSFGWRLGSGYTESGIKGLGPSSKGGGAQTRWKIGKRAGGESSGRGAIFWGRF